MLRIGELSRRVGVSDHVLRAWERRYGLLHPVRSPGGFRLYTSADERRVRRMLANLAAGLSTAEAAREVLAAEQAAWPAPDYAEARGRGALDEGIERLRRALDELDESAAQVVLDRLLADFTVEAVLSEVVLPYLRQLGERWEAGTVSVAHEHFASNVLRGRLASLARGWGRGRGPRAVLACPPGELHDLPLLAFGITLNRQGWRVDYLGADTPLEDLTRVVAEVGPDLVVLSAVTPERFKRVAVQLGRIARTAPLAIGGAGATRARADAIGARLLSADPVTAAMELVPPPVRT